MYPFIKNILISILLLMSFSAKTQDSANIGGVEIDLGFCEDTQYISSLMTAMTTVQWPTMGAPGFTMGVVTNPNVILDFCSLLTQLSQLSTGEGIFAAAEYLNKLTGKKWDDHLNITRSLYDTGTSTFNFEDGKPKVKQGLDAQILAQRLNSTVKDLSEYSNKYITKDNPVDARSRAQVESDIGRLAQIAYSQKKYHEMNNCPDPTITELPSNVESEFYGKYQKTKLEIEDARYEREILYDFLLRMGIKITDKDLSDRSIGIARENTYTKIYREYSDKLNQLLLNTHVLTEGEPKKQKVKSQEVTKIKVAADADPTADRVKKVSVKIDQSYQNFIVIKDRTILKEFTEKYSERWNSYVTRMKYSDTFGLAGGAFGAGNASERRIEREFSSIDLFCRPEELKKGLDQEDPEYYDLYNERLENCKNNAGEAIESADGLMTYYAERIFDLNEKIKEGQAYIYTFDSRYFGRYTKIESSVTQSSKYQPSYAREEVTCSPRDNVSDLQLVANKQQAVANEYNAMIAEKMVQLNEIEKKKLQKAKEEEEEREIREKLEKEQMNKQIDNRVINVPRMAKPPRSF